MISVTLPGGKNILLNDLTANADHSHDMDSHSLTFINGKQFKWTNNVAPDSGASFEFQGHGATIANTVFSIKNGSAQDALTVYGNKRVDFGGDLYAASGTVYMELMRNPFFITPGINLGSGIRHISRGEIGIPYVSHEFTTNDSITTAGSIMFRVSNFGLKLFDIDKDGGISMPEVQIGDTGLSGGQLYFDTAANVLLNGDLVCARKV